MRAPAKPASAASDMDGLDEPKWARWKVTLGVVVFLGLAWAAIFALVGAVFSLLG